MEGFRMKFPYAPWGMKYNIYVYGIDIYVRYTNVIVIRIPMHNCVLISNTEGCVQTPIHLHKHITLFSSSKRSYSPNNVRMYFFLVRIIIKIGMFNFSYLQMLEVNNYIVFINNNNCKSMAELYLTMYQYFQNVLCISQIISAMKLLRYNIWSGFEGFEYNIN